MLKRVCIIDEFLFIDGVDFLWFEIVVYFGCSSSFRDTNLLVES